MVLARRTVWPSRAATAKCPSLEPSRATSPASHGCFHFPQPRSRSDPLRAVPPDPPVVQHRCAFDESLFGNQSQWRFNRFLVRVRPRTIWSWRLALAGPFCRFCDRRGLSGRFAPRRPPDLDDVGCGTDQEQCVIRRMDYTIEPQNRLGKGDQERHDTLAPLAAHRRLGIGDHEENEKLIHRARDRGDRRQPGISGDRPAREPRKGPRTTGRRWHRYGTGAIAK